MKTSTKAKLSLVLLAAVLASSAIASNAAEPVQRVRFRDVTEATGVETRPHISFGAVLFDHDVDGDPDIFVNKHWKEPSFFENGSGSFRRSGETFFYTREMDRHACAWGEANGDGRPDLYCTQGANHGTSQGANQLLIQEADSFRDAARRSGAMDKFGRGRTANWLDHDSDGDLDLYITNARRASRPSILLANHGGRFRFERVGLELKTETNWPGGTWADWDADGDPDVLVVQGNQGTTHARENVGGRFVRAHLPGVTDRPWESASWGDFDGDGFPDLALTSKKELVIFKNVTGRGFEEVARHDLEHGRMGLWLDADNDGDLDLYVVEGADGWADPNAEGTNTPDFFLMRTGGTFERVDGPAIGGRTRGNGDAAAAGDFDGDGRVDLYVTNGHNPSAWRGIPSLLRNIGPAGSALSLRLNDSPANPFGYGATVRVRTGLLDYQRQVNDGVVYRAQTDVGWVHLGLGSSEVASLVVTWPDGSKDCLDLEAGRHVVDRGAAPCPQPLDGGAPS